jgi:hypothetical protein
MSHVAASASCGNGPTCDGPIDLRVPLGHSLGITGHFHLLLQPEPPRRATTTSSVCVRVRACACVCVCVRACGSEWERVWERVLVRVCTHICACIHTRVFVCFTRAVLSRTVTEPTAA